MIGLPFELKVGRDNLAIKRGWPRPVSCGSDRPFQLVRGNTVNVECAVLNDQRRFNLASATTEMPATPTAIAIDECSEISIDLTHARTRAIPGA